MNSMINTAQFSIELSYKWPTLVTFDIFKVESPLSSTLNMIYYTFDPQFGSLVFSIYSRYERCGLSVIPDAFSLATLSQPSSVLAYAHTVGLQLVAIGEYYASFLSQVRAGSVIFLVGLGSFVCWKIWDYCCNEEEASIAKKKGSSSPKTPQNRLKITRNPKEFFSAWTEEEFVDDFNNLQEEDPTLIQGKYFGPDEAVENELRLSNVSSPNFILQVNGNNVLKQRIDSARSIHNAEDDGAGSLTSDGDDESFGGRQLPLSIARKTRRTKKRHRRSSYKKNEPFNPMYKRELVVREHVYDSTSYNMPYHRFHPYEYDVHRTVVDISSSETSPRIAAQRSESSKLLWRSHLASFQKRCEGDGSETPEWDESSARKSSPHIPQPTFTCEEKDANDGRLQPDGEEQCTSADQKSLTTDVSMEDILERMRSQSSHKSSRDNSSTRTSNRFLRDDSIMSYLSDLNTSDCSELSLEFSAIEDSFAEHTIISFDDIEEELNTLKSSMHEMDQEYEKHAARPNPYLLKTTLSDLSVDSDDSLSGNSVAFSPLISKPLKSLSSIDVKTVQQEDAPGLSKSSKHRSGSNKSLRSLRGSVDFELPQEDWLLWKKNGDRRRGSSTETSSKFSQDEHPSLEWDNSCCLKQYEEENPTDKTKEDDALKFLPDHTSLELDLEMELQSPSDVRSPKLSAKKFFWGASLNTPITPFVNPTNFGNLDGAPFNILGPIPFPFQSESPPQSIEPVCYPKRSIDPPSSLDLGVTNRWSMPGDYMMTSVDSAVHSGPASRSGSSTPRQLFSQSMMSSGFASCVSEQPPSNFELEDVRVRRSWTSDEGSFVKIDPDEEFAQEDREKSHSLKTREEFFEHDRLREDLEPEDLIDEVFEEDIEPEDKDHLLSLDSTACTSSRSSYDESVTLIYSDNDAGVTVIDSDYVLGDSQPGSDTETQIKEKDCQENSQDVCQEVNQSESQSCQESVQDCKEKKIVSTESLEVISKEYQEVCDSATKECQKLCQENQCECTGQCQKDASENNQEDTQNIPVENFGKSEKSSYKGSQDLSNPCKNSDQEICIETCQNVCQKPCQEGCHESNPDTVVHRSTECDSLKDETETMGNKLCRKNSRDVQKATEKHPELSLLPIGEKQDIVAYATREWTGNTDRAETIRKGYSAIPQDLGLSHIRRVRGDNYCGIRASLYLALSTGFVLPSGTSVSKWLKSSYNAGSKWISDYNFGKRLQYSKDGLFEGIKDCLETMDKMVSDLRECENKASILRSMLNHDSVLDVRLCEAAKLLMLSASIDLYEELKKGAEVPLFASILFARESSVTPSQFLSNHLNAVGDTAGLEQVEMCLLGYALQVTLKVVRPSSYSSEDFVSSYPDDHLTDWPEVYLVAEDDRHYNVLVS